MPYPSTYPSTYPDGAGGGGGVNTGLFDATYLPKFHIWAGVGAAGALADISTDSAGNYAIRSIGRTFGRTSPIDSADPATLTVTFNNYWTADYDPASTGVNLLTNPGFETNTAGWFEGSGTTTLARVTTPVDSGAGAGRLTKIGGAGTATANTAAPDLSQVGAFAATAGLAYTFTGKWRANTTGRNCQLRIIYYNAAGTNIGGTTSTGITDNSGSWTPDSVTSTAPAGTTQAAVQVIVNSAALSEIHYFDTAVMAHPSGLTVGTPIELRVEWPVGTNVTRFVGTITALALDAGDDPTVTITTADGLEKLGRHDLDAGIGTFNDVESGRRINDLAALASWDITKQNFDDGIAQLWPTQELGASVLELMRLVEMTEMGLLFVNEAGTLIFWDRHHAGTATRSTVSQLSLTDTGAAGTVAMMDLVQSRDRGRVYNDIHLTRLPDPAQNPELTGQEPGDEPQERVARDWVSIGTSPDGSNHGFLNLPAEVGKLHNSDNAVQDQADMLLSWYSTVQDRIESVTLNMLAPKVKAENLFAALLALTLLDRITVTRDYGPRTIGPTDLLIEKIEETIEADPPTWQIKLTTSNPPPTPDRFRIGVSQLGLDPIGW